jgi:deoxyribodipyrimidine photo-lyase
LASSTNGRIAIFWYRRDLRTDDNAGLYHALCSGLPVLCLFIFDKHILDRLNDKCDARVTFIHDKVLAIQKDLNKLSTDLLVRYGTPEQIWAELMDEFDVGAVYTNHDYEPYALERDRRIGAYLTTRGIPFHTYKDQVIFEKQELMTAQNTAYTVFTPYSRAWKAKCNFFFLSSYPTERYFNRFLQIEKTPVVALTEIGFERTTQSLPAPEVLDDVIEQYQEKRNYPAQPGTTRLGIHLRFGTVSIRKLAQKATALSDTWLNELIWRDFYQQILWHFPHVGNGSAFRPEYDRIVWRNNETEFALWCEGKTGYPLVDAGMRELNETGFMHNRVRMVVASFLTKHLLIDWRWGEAYFAEKLLDYDLAANNGGWQWAAGSGTDAAPYFRIFNPTAQAEKFDPKGEYIRKWLPELNSLNYPNPIVDHKMARERCLAAYKKALAKF